MLNAKLAGEAIIVCTSKVRFDSAGDARRARRSLRNAPRLSRGVRRSPLLQEGESLMRYLLLVALGLTLAACASQLPVSPRKVEPGTFWCFEGKVKEKRGKRAVGCFDTLKFCRDSLATARGFWGRRAGAYDVTDCERFALQ